MIDKCLNDKNLWRENTLDYSRFILKDLVLGKDPCRFKDLNIIVITCNKDNLFLTRKVCKGAKKICISKVLGNRIKK